jgi:hypothetical protein
MFLTTFTGLNVAELYVVNLLSVFDNVYRPECGELSVVNLLSVFDNVSRPERC